MSKWLGNEPYRFDINDFPGFPGIRSKSDEVIVRLQLNHANVPIEPLAFVHFLPFYSVRTGNLGPIKEDVNFFRESGVAGFNMKSCAEAGFGDGATQADAVWPGPDNPDWPMWPGTGMGPTIHPIIGPSVVSMVSDSLPGSWMEQCLVAWQFHLSSGVLGMANISGYGAETRFYDLAEPIF